MAKRIVTHDGPFHADDVFAVAALTLIPEFADAGIIRSRDASVIANADIVIDVGRESDPVRHRFDHHQEGGAGMRENGVPYSSLGLIWKTFGRQLTRNDLSWSIMDGTFVQPIDAVDVGVPFVIGPGQARPYTLDDQIKAFYPTWHDKEEFDKPFLDALKLAKEILTRAIAHADAEAEATERIALKYDEASDKRLIVLDKHYPLDSFLRDHPDVLFIVRPYKGTAWSVSAAESEAGNFHYRTLFPEAWRAKEGEELKAATGNPDAIFCHRNGHVLFVQSQIAAIMLANLALSQAS